MIAVIAALMMLMFGYRAITGELSGVVKYKASKRSSLKTYHRDSDPENFRKAVNSHWMVSGFCLLVVGAFGVYYRWSEDVEE